MSLGRPLRLTATFSAVSPRPVLASECAAIARPAAAAGIPTGSQSSTAGRHRLDVACAVELQRNDATFQTDHYRLGSVAGSELG